MGWKCSMIIVSNVNKYDVQQVLRALGVKGFEDTGAYTLDCVIFPRDKSTFLGLYRGHLIITSGDEQMINHSLQSSVGPVEKKLENLFQNSEICTLSLASMVNHWGYALTRQGIKIRARAGDAKTGIVVDWGEPLPEELPLLNQSKLDESGRRIYWLRDFPNDPFTEDQVGESFVFAVFSRYFGKPLDESDALEEAQLVGYRSSSTPKPWWKNLPFLR